jgi:hypothetical protein
MSQGKKINNRTALLIIFILVSATFIILFLGFKNKVVENKTPPPVQSMSSVTDSSTKIFFASNGKNSVYKIKKGDKWSVIWNGTEGKDYDFVSNPVFSPDGNQLAYSAETGGQAYVVVNNTQEIYAYQKAGFITWNPNGQTIAFVATKDDASSVIITSAVITGTTLTITHGEESRTYGQIGTVVTSSGDSAAIIWSPNGQQVVYAIVENGKTYLIVNGQQNPTGYDNISNFSINNNGQYSYQAQVGDQIITVVNNHVISTTNSSSSPASGTAGTPGNIPGSSNSYRYRISTDKDINLDKNRLNYSGCAGAACNF